MIREALQYLREQFVLACDPVETGDDHKTVLLLPDGSTKEFRHPPGPRRHHFSDLDDFCAALTRYSNKDQTVWVHLEQCVCVLCDVQDGYRDNVLVLSLRPTSVFGALDGLKGAMDQRTFVRALRTTFGTCEWSDDLRLAVETMKFTRMEEGESTVSHKGDSLGKAVKASVSGLKDPLPPKVTCRFSAFPLINHEGLKDTVNVECDLFIDHVEQKFTLTPLPHSVDEARLMATEAMREAIAKLSGVPAYIGAP